MRTFLDCVPCIVRQCMDAVRLVNTDETTQEQILRQTLRDLADVDYDTSPPVMAQAVHRRVREAANGADAYKEMKQGVTKIALEMLPRLHDLVTHSETPLEVAVRLAIAGNIIDVAVNRDIDRTQIRKGIEHALQAPLNADLVEFANAVSQARTILYLADNAGEIVFDRLLIEQLSPEKVTVAVRGAPVINDATMEDARESGITELVEVIDNGSDAPGTILADCNAAFRSRFEQADLVIAKGQGNYETLSDVDKDIFFVLKAKCPVIANNLGCPVGSLILRRSGRGPQRKSNP